MVTKMFLLTVENSIPLITAQIYERLKQAEIESWKYTDHQINTSDYSIIEREAVLDILHRLKLPTPLFNSLLTNFVQSWLPFKIDKYLCMC